MSDEIVTSPFDFDGVWKMFIEYFWPEILRVCVPSLYEAADIKRKAEFLDKEMSEISEQLDGTDGSSKRYVDSLLKIYLKDGSEEWVLFHVEVQGKGGERISLRMFRYSCLIFLRYNKHPSALAILTAKRPKKEGEPAEYSYDVFGTTLKYRYPTLRTCKLSHG